MLAAESTPADAGHRCELPARVRAAARSVVGERALTDTCPAGAAQSVADDLERE